MEKMFLKGCIIKERSLLTAEDQSFKMIKKKNVLSCQRLMKTQKIYQNNTTNEKMFLYQLLSKTLLKK